MRTSRSTQTIAGGLLGTGLLVLLFRGTDWPELQTAVREIDLGWLLLAQVILFASYLTRAQRWIYVVRAVQPASFRNIFSATQIGYLMNFTIPARLGELVRAYVLSRLAGVPLARSMAMVTLDRVNDVIGLLAVLLVAGIALASEVTVKLPAGSFGNTEPIVVSSNLVRPAGFALAALVLAGLAVLVGLYLRQEPVVQLVRAAVQPLSPALAERAARLLASFAGGLHVFRSGADLARTVFWSLVTWGGDVASVAAVLVALGIEFPWYTPFLVIGLIGIVIAFPLTPGVIGQYHVPAAVGLLMCVPEVSPTRARAFAIVDHLSALVPIAVLGLWCLHRERLGLVDLARTTGAPKGSADEMD